ncbi:hypothetical protein [Streptomyces griseus]|uniref:hypothetical protein n=1 Tax=Streptomyces griseus TaxID=1911 RepID=UPI00378ACE47
MNVNQCPTPKKRAYDSRDAAHARAVVSDRKLNPYRCQCGKWHLTMRDAAAPTVQEDALELLAAMTDVQFDNCVTAELYGGATPETAAALRTPDMAPRWGAVLKRRLASMQAELALKKGMDDPATKEWRAATVRRMGFIHGRQIEVNSIMKAALHQAQTSEQQLRARAANAAKRRLVGAHFDEYREYVTEELARRGLQFVDRTEEVEGPAPETIARSDTP